MIDKIYLTSKIKCFNIQDFKRREKMIPFNKILDKIHLTSQAFRSTPKRSSTQAARHLPLSTPFALEIEENCNFIAEE